MNRKLGQAFLIIVSVLILLFVTQPWLQPLEDQWLDGQFQDSSRSVPIDPAIRLVFIDDRSLQKIETPTTFWAPYFAQAVASLVEAGAIVGLDWVPYDVDEATFQALAPVFKLGDPDSSPWLPLHLALEKRGRRNYVQGVFPDFQGDRLQGQYRPAIELMALAGPHQLGYLNLSRDEDGVLRRQSVLPLLLTKPLWGSKSYPPLAGRLAEVTRQEVFDPAHPTLAGKPLPLSQGGLLRINYPPRRGALPSWSFADVLSASPQLLSREFSGKTVLIGPGASLFQDLVQTPIGEMPGVEAHAYTLNTLLTGNCLQDTPAPWRLAQLVGMAALGAVIGLSIPSLAGLLAILILSLLWGAGAQWLFRTSGLVTPLVVPLLSGWCAWGLGALLRSRGHALEKLHIRQLFGRYVSPDVMEVLLRDPRQAVLGAVGKRRITVLFVDINGFSTHCEKRTPEEIMAMLNGYFEEMNRLIFAHGGCIKQFVGDEIMAMYGAPSPHPRPEAAAVETAVAMIRKLRQLHAQDPHEERGFYLIKVGIHSGDVILGNVGSAERTEYAAVGDDVNLGSRIMGLTKPLQSDILISKEIYDKVADCKERLGVEFVAKGAHSVKGRHEPVEIFQVVP